MPDLELVRILQMLEALKLDWGDQYLTYFGWARSDKGFRVQANIGVVEDFPDPGPVADFSLIRVAAPGGEFIFDKQYLSERLESFAGQYDPESERYLRNWIRRQLAEAIKVADKRREEHYSKFWG